MGCLKVHITLPVIIAQLTTAVPTGSSTESIYKQQTSLITWQQRMSYQARRSERCKTSIYVQPRHRNFWTQTPLFKSTAMGFVRLWVDTARCAPKKVGKVGKRWASPNNIDAYLKMEKMAERLAWGPILCNTKTLILHGPSPTFYDGALMRLKLWTSSELQLNTSICTTFIISAQSSLELWKT